MTVNHIGTVTSAKKFQFKNIKINNVFSKIQLSEHNKENKSRDYDLGEVDYKP